MSHVNNLLEAADILFNKKGYGFVSLEDFADQTETKEIELKKEFPNAALICANWLTHKHDRSDKIHNAILMESKPAVEKVDDYFTSLANYMEETQYRGCPFSNVATNLTASQEDLKIRHIVAKHKKSLREFLRALAVDISFEHADLLAETLFLLYSGATTESRNINSLEPVHAARTSAIKISEIYATSP